MQRKAAGVLGLESYAHLLTFFSTMRVYKTIMTFAMPANLTSTSLFYVRAASSIELSIARRAQRRLETFHELGFSTHVYIATLNHDERRPFNLTPLAKA